MLNASERFQWLAREFEALLENLDESSTPDERKQLRKRMKTLLDEIDDLVFSSLKRDKQNTAGSRRTHESTPES
jgi:hypothetical protein